VIARVLQNLLTEEVPIRDLRSIVEALAEQAPATQDAGILTSAVRIRLGRMIVQQINGMSGELPVATLDPALEQLLLSSQQGDGQGVALEPGLAERVHRSLDELCQQRELAGEAAVLLVPAAMRQGIARWLRGSLPQLRVLAYDEVPQDCRMRIVASISGQ